MKKVTYIPEMGCGKKAGYIPEVCWETAGEKSGGWSEKRHLSCDLKGIRNSYCKAFKTRTNLACSGKTKKLWRESTEQLGTLYSVSHKPL